MLRATRQDDQNGPTLGEVAVLGAGVWLGLLAMASLVLAALGVHRGGAAVAASTVALGVLVAAGRRRVLGPVRFDGAELAVGAALVALCAALVLPGFGYAVKRLDPGVYVGHALAIARTHDLAFPDPALDLAVPVEVHAPEGERSERDAASERVAETTAGPVELHCCDTFRAWPADPDDPTRIFPSFLHAWPALLATAAAVGGRTGLVDLTPAFGMLSVLAVFLAVRRGAGTVAAVLAAGLLAVDMMQAWQARYPTAEMAMQCFFVVAVLGVAVGVRARWRPALAVAGFATGMTFVLRPDGLLLVLILAAAVATLEALGRARWATGPLLAGLAAVLPLALYEAYGLNAGYTAGKIPSLATVSAIGLLLAAGAVGVRMVRGRHPGLDLRVQTHAGRAARLAVIAVPAALAAFFLVAALRPVLLGQELGRGFSGDIVRKYDEDNLLRLTWFVTPAALPAAVVGTGLLLSSPRGRALCGLVAAGVLLTPLYVWEPRIAPVLMWWVRRYVPVVLVFLVVAAAVTAGRLLTHRGRLQGASIALGAALVAWMGLAGVTQSVALRDHDEWGGSFAVIDQLGELGDEEPTTFVWLEPDAQMALFASTLTTHLGEPSLAIERDDPEVVGALAGAYPGRRLLVISGRRSVRSAPGPPIARIDGSVERWETSLDHRPDGARAVPVRWWVFEV